MLIKPSVTWGLYTTVLLFSILPLSRASASHLNLQDTVTADMSLEDLISLDVFEASSRLPTPLSKAPGTVYSFGQDDFKRYGVRRLDDLLQLVPGMQVNQSRKRHRSIWVRGMLQRYNDKLVLLVDGIRQQHLYYGHFSLGDNFPLERIEKVEIIQGPASSLYGASAFSGLISITTKDFSDQPKVQLSAELGNNDRRKLTGMYNSESVQLFGSALDQDAPFSKDRRSFIGTEVLQPLNEDYQTLHLKANIIPELSLTVDYSASHTPFVFIPSTQDAFVESSFLSTAIKYESGDVEQGRLETSLYYQRDNGREYEIEQQTRLLAYEENQDATMAGATATVFKAFDAHTLMSGVSWRHEVARSTDYTRNFKYSSGFLTEPETGSLLNTPKLSNNDSALFFQDVWHYSAPLEITLGMRFDSFECFGDYLNYRAALVYSPEPEQSWKLLYGTAIRTPSFREYAKILEGTNYQPPTLTAERMKTLELAYIYQAESFSANVTLFNNELEDYIVEQPTPNGADEFFANSPDHYYLYGIESLIELHPVENVVLSLTAGYVDVKKSKYEVLPYVANWTGSANLSYHLAEQRQLGLSLVYNTNRSDTNDYPQDDPGSFWLANVHLSGSLTPRLDYQLGVDNLFDKKIYDPAADFGGQYNPEASRREFWLRLEWAPKFL